MDSLKPVPLKLLHLSPLNVRQTNPAEGIEELANDIAAHGLLKNLVAIAGKRGQFDVVAGGRRLQALEVLRDRGDIPADHPVPVLVVDRDQAREVSLSENIHRVALNPADEVEAFAKIVADHPDETDPVALCARRQGVTRHRVEQSLRLAQLAPEILGALRAGEIPLDAARAYVSVADPALQLQVFHVECRRTFGAHNPREIRDQLKGRTYPAEGYQARYVGLEAYRAAGGRIDAELLLGAEFGERLLNPSLLEDLVRAKAEAELAARAERDGFASGILTKSFTELPIWPSAPAGYRLGEKVRDPRVMSVLPSFAVRETAIGIYGLAGAGLSPIGYFVPEQPPAAEAPAAAPPAAPPPGPRSIFERMSSMARGAPPAPASAAPAGGSPPGDRLRVEALKLAAARIAVEHQLAFADGQAAWPSGQGYIPALTTEIGDDDTFLVAVQIRVARADLEAAIGEAEDQLEADADANDRVAEADLMAHDDDSGGGGDRLAFRGAELAA